jgi:hypothetical protein
MHLPPGLLDSPPHQDGGAGDNPLPLGIQRLCSSCITSPPTAVLPNPALAAATASTPAVASPGTTATQSANTTAPNAPIQPFCEHPTNATIPQEATQHTSVDPLSSTASDNHPIPPPPHATAPPTPPPPQHAEPEPVPAMRRSKRLAAIPVSSPIPAVRTCGTKLKKLGITNEATDIVKQSKKQQLLRAYSGPSTARTDEVVD